MKKYFLVCLYLIFSHQLFAQTTSSGWSASGVNAKRFIENKSQFDGRDKLSGSKILFGIDDNGTQIYFTKQGLTYRFDESDPSTTLRMTNEEERESKKTNAEEWAEHEKEEHSVKIKTDIVHLQWENANPNVEVVAEEMSSDYYSYSIGKAVPAGRQENINYIHGYKKLIYKNLYPNIDVEYIFPPSPAGEGRGEGGIKYSLILHPGADISQVKMTYTGDKKIFLDKKGNVHIPTSCGDIIDHAPKTFYGDNHKNISSAYVLKNNSVSFSLPKGEGRGGALIVIDPWTQTPALSNSKGVWECERDGAGNVYIIGGDSPMKLLKYNAAGTLQWTYATPWDTANNWLGTLATDLAGNSYVTSGSIAALNKINPAGGVVWTYTAPLASVDEYWTISFNCDQTKLIVGGTTGNGFNIKGAIFDINTANGNINSKQIVGQQYNTFPPYINEARALTSSHNGRYYYLTLDTIGCIDQNFSACSNGAPIFAINSGYTLGYKCENDRPKGNGGIKSIRADKNFVYTQNGTTIQKRSLANGSILGSAAIPGGISTASFGRNTVGNSGIDIDTCGNVYVGSGNAIIKYDANLNLLSQVALPFHVYDIAVSTAGNVIVCGTTGTAATVGRTGYVQSIASFTSCNPIILQCCDATICNAGPFCNTDPPHTLSSSTSGGTWSGTGITNSSTGVFDPSVSGTGTFTITYSLACGNDAMQIVVKTCATPTVCVEANGDLTASGGVGPYHWDAWNNGGSTPITTQAQCTACNGSYTWFGNQCLNGFMPVNSCTTAPSYQQYATGTTATPPGTWPIRVVDANGNILVINSMSGIQSCSSVLNVNTTQVNILCAPQCSGSATVTPTSGTPPYTYAWSNSQSTSAITGLCIGTYTVLVTDSANITTTASVTITQPVPLTSSITATSASCGSGGSATANAAGGTASYTYNWTGGQTTPTATGLAAGNYTVTVTDAHGCTTTSTVSINSSNSGTLTVTSTNILCNGDSTGTANATMSGGTSPFTYNWTSGQTTSSVTNFPAGNYSVIVTDANGCTTTQAANITQPAAITSSVSITNTTCGANTGSASVTANGGTGTLTYNWNPSGQTTSAATALGVGNYSCTITDGNGCTQVQTANIVNANGPAATTSVINNVLCNGGNNGSASASATGGSAPYTYSWNTSPPQNSQTATGLSSGNYTITVTDASGCSNTQTVAITQPAAITGSVSTTASSCGNTDGTATATPSGGSAPYTYLWNPTAAATATATGLSAGNYSVIITDANGCSKTFTTTVTNSNGPTAVAGSSTTITSGNSAPLTASGGVSYSWSPATGLSCSNCANPTASPSVTTTYCVFVSDVSGCMDSTCVTIYVDAPCVHNYYLPNAFSPNGDYDNDVLHIYTGNINCIAKFQLDIYDRWGELLFTSTNPAESWDGTHKGKIMDSQVVVYYLQITFIDGTEVDKKGNVSLVK